MSDPTTGVVMAASAAGITILGVATGLQPAILLAGLAGGWWAQSYIDSEKPVRRVMAAIGSAIVAAYSAPALAAAATSIPGWPAGVEAGLVQLPIALVIGLLAHKVIGPALVRFASKKAEEVTK